MRRYDRSRELFERAKRCLAGGVSSNVRASDKPQPLYFRRGYGSRIFDVDGNEYIDYVLGRGPLLLGHSHPGVAEAVKAQAEVGQIYAAQHEQEVALAERICAVVPCAELVRFSCSGSEADHAALRLARAVTGRSKIVKFEGHYHGWFDNIFVSYAPGPGEDGWRDENPAVPESLGQVRSESENVIVLPWNNLDAFRRTAEKRPGEIAAAIMEPVMGNTGVIPPAPGYLAGVREICSRLGIVLIFDEVITGFRVSLGGAQAHLDVTPDLAVFGKAVASGYPLSCLAGKRAIMELIAGGKVVHGGTFNGHPVCVAAALRTVAELEKDGGSVYGQIRSRGEALMAGIRERAARRRLPVVVQGYGPLFTMAFAPHPLTDYRTSLAVDHETYDRFVCAMSDRGVRILRKGVWFLSAAHTAEDIERTLAAVDESLGAL